MAFFDIMGFKDFISRNSHEEVKNKMNKLKNILLSIRINYKKKETPIKPVMFSDSIILISNLNSIIDLKELIHSIIFLIKNCFKANIPIKGAISKGMFTCDSDNSLYFGQPLIDAYKIQNSIKYYGCIIDNVVENDYINYCNNFILNKILVKYKTPFTKGKVNHYNLNWLVFDKISEYIYI